MKDIYVILLCVAIVLSLMIIYNINDRSPIPPNPDPISPEPTPHEKMIGGCKGTQYGCCPDKVTPCKNKECFNCNSLP